MSAQLSQLNVTTSATFSRYRYVIAFLILLAHLSLGVNFFSVSPLLPFAIETYEVTRASASLLVAVPTLLKAIIGLPGSVVVNRFGLKRVFMVSWYLVAATTLSGLAPNFYWLLLLRLLYGIGAGLMMPAIGPLVMQWFRPKEIPIINSLNLIVMSLGIAVSVATAVPLTAFLSWQIVLTVFGSIGLLGALLWQLLGQTRDTPQEEATTFHINDVWRVFSNRTVFLLVVSDALVFIFYAAITSWLPTYLNEFRGITLVEAGNITGLLPFVGMFSVLVGGILAVRVKSKRLLFIVPGILVAIGGFGSFLFTGQYLIYAAVILLGIGVWIYQPILLTLPMQLPWMTPKKIAVVWGSSLTIAGFGMFISPIVVGASRDLFGTFVPGFLIWAVLALSLIAAGILLPESSTFSKNSSNKIEIATGGEDGSY